MKTYKKVLSATFVVFIIAYVGVLGWFYIYQEQFIFPSNTLPYSYQFSFNIPFQEIEIPAQGGAKLDGLLFKADSSKGLLFYLHGNRGALNRWGTRAGLFVQNKFDTFMMDYRGYGKSTGQINNEEEFLNDVDRAYQTISARYPDKPKVIVGYSLGTGPAAFLAQKYQPDLLVLMAPYYNLPDVATQLYPFLPEALSKYEFATNRYLPKITSKVVIFHGLQDRLIDINASKRLSHFFIPGDTLIMLENQGHSRMFQNGIFRSEVTRLLKAF